MYSTDRGGGGQLAGRSPSPVSNWWQTFLSTHQELVSPILFSEFTLLQDMTPFLGENASLQLQAVVTSENVTEYSYDVAEATANVADINAEGLRAISDALEKIVNAGNSSTEVITQIFRDPTKYLLATSNIFDLGLA